MEQTARADPPFWTRSPDIIFADLSCGRGGLTSAEASQRLKRFGPNSDAPVHSVSGVRAVVRRLFEPLSLIVFRVLGGYILATGVLTMTLAATSFRARNRVAALGALVGGAASIGLMATVNFIIDSNFKWVLLIIAFAWGCSLALFWFESRSRRGSQT